MRLNSKLLIIILFGIILAACQDIPPTPQPQPQATEPARPITHVSYMPVTGLSTPSDKACIALAYYSKGIPYAALGLDRDVCFHTWGAVGGQTPEGDKVSVVWCDSLDENYDYEAGFRTAVEAGAVSQYVLFANEPDRGDQCNASPERIAQSYLNLVDICPDCLFVGPMYSTADNGLKVAAWFNAVYDLCGRPCPAMSQLYALSLHIYPRGPQSPTDPRWSNYLPSERVTELCQIVHSGDCPRPVWVTEVGWESAWSGERDGFAEWVRDMEGDERIERYFVYSPWQEPGGRFLPLVGFDSGLLTQLGYGFRDGVWG